MATNVDANRAFAIIAAPAHLTVSVGARRKKGKRRVASAKGAKSN